MSFPDSTYKPGNPPLPVSQPERRTSSVCLVGWGVPGSGADSRHPSRHSWQCLSRTRTNQVTLLYPSPNRNVEHLVFVLRVEKSCVVEQKVLVPPSPHWFIVSRWERMVTLPSFTQQFAMFKYVRYKPGTAQAPAHLSLIIDRKLSPVPLPNVLPVGRDKFPHGRVLWARPLPQYKIPRPRVCLGRRFNNTWRGCM